MVRTLSNGLARAANRRGFLRTAISAAEAIALALLGMKPAYAFPVACCFLCKDPSTCRFSGCSCTWSWPCRVNNGDGTCDVYSCAECYSSEVCPKAAEDNGCGGIICSRASFVGTTDCPGEPCNLSKGCS